MSVPHSWENVIHQMAGKKEANLERSQSTTHVHFLRKKSMHSKFQYKTRDFNILEDSDGKSLNIQQVGTDERRDGHYICVCKYVSYICICIYSNWMIVMLL